LWTIIVLCLASCSNDKWDVNPDDVDLGNEFRVRTFHQDIQDLPKSDSVAVEKLVRVYGEFWADYSEDILKLGAFNDSATVDALRQFLTHESTVETLAAIDTTSGSSDKIDQISSELENGFKRFHALMPTEPVPDIILMSSGFNFSVYPSENYLAIGLEWFIGHDHPILDKLPQDIFPQYRKMRMHPDLLSANAFRGWMLVNFQNRGYTGRMLSDDILYWGKVLWLTHKCMPELHDHLLMDWTLHDLEWALANEESIWLELQPADVIFETNRTAYNKWLTEGPFTRAGTIPQESPDKLGIWMGWRIIEDYMDANPQTTIDELFDNREASEFLRTYRP
jgi:hypothetical protein